MSKNIRLPDYEQGIIMAQIDQIRRLEAERDRLQRLYATAGEQCVRETEKVEKLREAIRRSIRLLSYGGDAEVMAILERALDPDMKKPPCGG